MNSNAITSSKFGEILAITFLNNARLSETTLTDANIVGIFCRDSRAKNEAQRQTTVANFKGMQKVM